jgi:hypothetical protein
LVFVLLWADKRVIKPFNTSLSAVYQGKNE